MKNPDPERLREGIDADQPETDVAGALHEVSNALTVVLGWLDVALGQLPPNAPELGQALEVASTHARLGYQVARRAIGAEVTHAVHSERSATQLAHAAVIGVRPEAERREIEVVVESRGAAALFVPDAAAALQVLTNLLLNAIEHTPRGKRISLALRSRSGRAVFTVADEGPGLAPDRATTLFSAPSSTRNGGAGIGLRHSRALAQAKGGELRLVQSQPHAAFELRWPSINASRPSQRIPQPETSLAGLRVLVVEDDPAVSSLLELSLSSHDVITVSADTADAYAKALGNQEPFGAALVDLSPLADDVVGALERLRDHSSGIVVLLISGIASGVPEQCAGLVDGWVRKPFEVSEIVTGLETALGRRAE